MLTGSTFLGGPDEEPAQCDVYAQDCPMGQKCSWTAWCDASRGGLACALGLFLACGGSDVGGPGQTGTMQTPMPSWGSFAGSCIGSNHCVHCWSGFGQGPPGNGQNGVQQPDEPGAQPMPT